MGVVPQVGGQLPLQLLAAPDGSPCHVVREGARAAVHSRRDVSAACSGATSLQAWAQRRAWCVARRARIGRLGGMACGGAQAGRSQGHCAAALVEVRVRSLPPLRRP